MTKKISTEERKSQAVFMLCFLKMAAESYGYDLKLLLHDVKAGWPMVEKK